MKDERLYQSSLLMSRVRMGDEKAFAELYHATNRAIFNAVMVYVKDLNIAEELVQLTYIKLWNQRDRLDNIDDPHNYLFIIAKNITLDHFRKVTVQSKLLNELQAVPALPVEDLLKQLDEKEVRLVLHAAIKELPPQQQRAYILATEQELSHAQIAELMNISPSTVKRHLEIARRSVRQFVQNHTHLYLALGFWLLK